MGGQRLASLKEGSCPTRARSGSIPNASATRAPPHQNGLPARAPQHHCRPSVPGGRSPRKRRQRTAICWLGGAHRQTCRPKSRPQPRGSRRSTRSGPVTPPPQPVAVPTTEPSCAKPDIAPAEPSTATSKMAASSTTTTQVESSACDYPLPVCFIGVFRPRRHGPRTRGRWLSDSWGPSNSTNSPDHRCEQTEKDDGPSFRRTRCCAVRCPLA